MASTLPPDLFDTTTLVSLASTLLILAVAYGASQRVLAVSTPGSLRALFIWHAFDALIHFFLEGSYLYHCFFTSAPAAALGKGGVLHPTPANFLGDAGWAGNAYGPQAGGNSPTAGLWMVYARADRRWAGADLMLGVVEGIISLELLTVLGAGPAAVYICYLIAKRDPRASIWMIIVATAELYGGFITFCPEWLTGNLNLDGSNFMYMWVYLVFFNMLWVFIPLYAIWVSYCDIMDAFRVRGAKAKRI